MKKYATILLIIAISIASLLLIKFFRVNHPTSNNNVLYETAKVINIKDEILQEDPLFTDMYNGYQDIEIELLSGKYKGSKYNIRNNMSRLYNVNTKKNMKVIVGIYFKDNKMIDLSIYSYKRDKVLYVLVAVFFLALLLVGKKNGLKSIISLIFTGIMIIFFLLPAIFKGTNSIFAAIITAIITTIVSLLLIGGRNKKTLSAMLGTILGVIIAGIIAHAAGKLSHLSGLTMQDADSLIYIAEKYQFNIKGLMFVSILIASLGAIMDVGMSIASSIYEMDKLSPNLTFKDLFNSGMNVGKDIIGTMSNTLILAFAGTSLNLMIFIYSAQMPYKQLINIDVLNSELIQSISGSIGIILTVPITALISVLLIKGNKAHKNSC